MQRKDVEFVKILVTGGAGFIGSNFIHHLLDSSKDVKVVNYDLLTYAGNLENLAAIEKDPRYAFVKGDIADRAQVAALFEAHNFDVVVNFAAESHVDRSLHIGPEAFIRTNVLGTQILLDAARERKTPRFVQISTDEVYGSLEDGGRFTEQTNIQPNNPYAATKAAADCLVRAAHKSHGLNVVTTRCSNNFGPFQFPEKLIPLTILNMIEGKPLPVYGDGKNIRDWLYVEDHASGIWTVVRKGKLGESYNIGGENEWENIRLIRRLARLVADKTGKSPVEYEDLITYVRDRPGHDRRYAINCEKIKDELGWRQSLDFDKGLSQTVDWYLNNPSWISRVRSGEYKNWLDRNYRNR